jgi:hypothetical protein
MKKQTVRTKSEHTPTPWTLNKSFGNPVISVDGDSDWPIVPEVSGPTVKQAKANAAFIVRAVNAYDELKRVNEELLAALKSTLPDLQNWNAAHNRGKGTAWISGLIAKCEQALAKAEGK